MKAKNGARAETLLWSMLAGIISARFWLGCVRLLNGTFVEPQVQEDPTINDVFAVYSLDFIAGFLVLVFPFIFWWAVGDLPLRFFAQRRHEDRATPTAREIGGRPEDNNLKDGQNTPPGDPITMLKAYTEESHRLALRVLTTASIHLVVGVVIALGGVIYFGVQFAKDHSRNEALESSFDQYWEKREDLQSHYKALSNVVSGIVLTNDSRLIRESFEKMRFTGDDMTRIEEEILQLSPSKRLGASVDGWGVIIEMLPRFGVLFFIEFIAIFFLKQYGRGMDEHRYYEAIARHRQENLLILQLVKNKDVSPLDLVEKTRFYSEPNKLKNGETTELLQSRTLDKHDAEVFQKIIDAMVKMKTG